MREKPSYGNRKTNTGRDNKGERGSAGKGFKRDGEGGEKGRSSYKASGESRDRPSGYNKERGGDDSKRPYARKEDGDRKSYGDKPGGERRKFEDRGERKPYGDREKRSFDKPEREGKRFGDRDDKKPYARKEEGERRSYGDKPGGERRKFEDRGEKKPYGDREKRSFDKPEREGKRFGDRDDKKPYARKEEGERKSYGDKPDGERRKFEDRGERKPYGDREKRSFDKPEREGKRFGDRDDKKPYARKEEGERRSYGDKPDGERRKFEDRGERKPYGDKENREKRSFDKPEREGKRFGDRDDKKPFSKEEGKDGEKPKRGRERFEDKDLSFGKNSARNKETKKAFRKDDNNTDERPARFDAGEEQPKRTFKKVEKEKEEGDFSKAYPLGARKVSGPFRKQFEEEQAAAAKGIRKPRVKKAEGEEEEIKEMTLNKYISHSGQSSRRDAAEMVKQGKVKVNGELMLDPGYRVQPYDIVTIAGKKLTPQRNRVYILLNKPKGFLTTTDDPEGRKTVMDLVNPQDAGVDRLFPVGRLDRNTTGLILLTNDGDLAQKLSHPSYEIKKVYQVTLDKNITKADFDKVVTGVELEDGMATVDALAYLDNKNELGLEIHSGRNRIVRRIFEALGYEVEKLDRVMYAGLTKKNLPRSNWRFLEEKEIILLKHFKS